MTNPFGVFPIYQCSPLDNKSSCKLSSSFTNSKSYGNQQYCILDYIQSRDENEPRVCIKFKGFQGAELVQEHDTCSDFV